MARKNAIDRAIEALEAKKQDVLAKATDQANAMQASIDVLKAQRPKAKAKARVETFAAVEKTA